MCVKVNVKVHLWVYSTVRRKMWYSGKMAQPYYFTINYITDSSVGINCHGCVGISCYRWTTEWCMKYLLSSPHDIIML